MTIEEAIELLQTEIHDHQLFLEEYTGNYLNAPELRWIKLDTLCIEALEKQISRKVKWEFGGYAYCPNCGVEYEDILWHRKFCPACGQRLDWEEEE